MRISLVFAISLVLVLVACTPQATDTTPQPPQQPTDQTDQQPVQDEQPVDEQVTLDSSDDVFSAIDKALTELE